MIPLYDHSPRAVENAPRGPLVVHWKGPYPPIYRPMERREYVPTFTAFAQPIIARPSHPQPGELHTDVYVIGFRVKTGEVVFITTEMEEVPASEMLLVSLPDNFKFYG